ENPGCLFLASCSNTSIAARQPACLATMRSFPPEAKPACWPRTEPPPAKTITNGMRRKLAFFIVLIAFLRCPLVPTDQDANSASRFSGGEIKADLLIAVRSLKNNQPTEPPLVTTIIVPSTTGVSQPLSADVLARMGDLTRPARPHLRRGDPPRRL